MFEYAETDPTLSDEEAGPDEDKLRVALLRAQYRRLEAKKQTLLIVLAGLDGAGKGSTINLLNTWLDPRHIHTLAYEGETDQEAARPTLWRWWRDLPASGQTGIVFTSWYTPLFEEASRKNPDADAMAREAALVNRFEAMLAADKVQVLKLWFHMSREAQRERAEKMLADPDTAWRVSKDDLRVHKKFERLCKAGELLVGQTDRPHAPWVIIPSADDNMRTHCTARAILSAMNQAAPAVVADPPLPVVLLPETASDHKPEPAGENGEYDQALEHWQGRVARASRHKSFDKHGVVMVFEGQDAAGKGGCIRRVTAALDVRDFDVHPIQAPTDEERARPYLWRFWRNLPDRGKVAIFDRSWYGRVLVERVEKFAAPKDIARAYDEINDFELQLTSHGTLVLKFWLDVSKQVQFQRFKEREESAFKTFKITPDDWRNREKWTAYQRARQDMLARTSTENAPWHVVPSDDKKAARIQVLQTVALALEGMRKKR